MSAGPMAAPMFLGSIPGGGPPAPAKLLTVPNYAALVGVGAGFTGGELAYVLTLKTFYNFVPSSALAIDPVGMTTSGTAAGGTSRWERTEFASPDWRLRDNWYVDPVAGNDENTGATAVTAIKTLAELARRWGAGPVAQVADPNFCVNLFILNDVAAPDALVLRPVFAPDTALRIFGGVSSVIRAGTVTGYTAQVPGLNQPAQLDDAAFLGAWELGERLRITTPGPSFNATCQIQNDLGGGSCNVSVPAYADESTFMTVPTALFPVVGDAYAVERLRTVPLGYVKPPPSVGPSGYLPVVDMVDCNLVSVGPPGVFQESHYIEGTGSLVFALTLYQCTIDISSTWRGTIAVNSFFRAHQIEFREAAQANGGGAWIPAGAPAFLLVSALDANTTLDYNFQSWGQAVVVDQPTVLGSFAVFNGGASFLNPGGHGVRIGNGGQYTPPTKARLRGLCWGAGSFGKGLHLSATSSCEHGPQPTITGGAGDFSIYLPPTARAWDEAAGAYTAPLVCTWALYGTPIAFGGFGQNAHQLYADAHLCVNAAP